jgi:hypothetical protein
MQGRAPAARACARRPGRRGGQQHLRGPSGVGPALVPAARPACRQSFLHGIEGSTSVEGADGCIKRTPVMQGVREGRVGRLPPPPGRVRSRARPRAAAVGGSSDCRGRKSNGGARRGSGRARAHQTIMGTCKCVGRLHGSREVGKPRPLCPASGPRRGVLVGAPREGVEGQGRRRAPGRAHCLRGHGKGWGGRRARQGRLVAPIMPSALGDSSGRKPTQAPARCCSQHPTQSQGEAHQEL